MRRAWVLAAVLGMGLCSCAALNPKRWSIFSGNKPKNPPEQNTTLIPDSHPVPPPPAPPGRTTSHQGNGVLAGQVIDAFHQRRPYATIQVSPVDGGEKPREIQTDSQGYFVAQGLKPGQRYKLIARVRLGEKVLTGVTYATPPNVVVNVIVREDLTEGESNVPADRAAREPDGTPRSNGSPQSYRPETAPRNDGQPWAPAGWRSETEAWRPNREFPATPAVPLGNPSLLNGNVPVLSRSNLEGIGRSNAGPAGNGIGSPPGQLPLAQLANPIPWPGAASRQPPVSPTPALTVPACRITANRVDDFALLDLNGKVFQWRQSPARLTLLDFWGTWCRPCLQSIPHLVDLQRRYGAHGLQVIGISYEDGTPLEQRQRVNFIRQRLGMNYQILLGHGENCPVKNALGVHSFPTLVLLDQQGTIVWRCEGLDSLHLVQLENEIRRRLN